MKHKTPTNPTDLADVPLGRVVYHALCAYLIPLGAFTRWAGLRTILRIGVAHLKPVWLYRCELKYEGKLQALVRRVRRKLGV